MFYCREKTKEEEKENSFEPSKPPAIFLGTVVIGNKRGKFLICFKEAAA